jgi:hypothetical protein
VNLEQLGRTDDTDGPRIAAAIITGYRFSELPELLRKPMLAAGIRLEENLKYGDAFFQASDNRSLAAVGIPSHTISLSYRFPDAHRPGDEWQKLDYDNMAKVTRGIAAGVLAIANRAQAPRWLTANPKAQPYADKATLLSTPREASAPESGSSPASPKPRRLTP